MYVLLIRILFMSRFVTVHMDVILTNEMYV